MNSPSNRILNHASEAVPLLLAEVRTLAARPGRPLLGFATGGTFTAFFRALADELAQGRLDASRLVATHLDEYLGFGPERFGGMVHELCDGCPPLREWLPRGAFFPVPNDGTSASIAAHEAKLQGLGGVQLQFLGIGRNGHLAFNEPATPFDSGFHVTELAETTRNDARARFAPQEPPTRAVTSGLVTILAAKRLVLCAFGAAKAPAVRAMLQGPIDPTCPASLLRRHPDAHVLLDKDAAAGLAPA
jgi:glucosamine-6-phosphate deaminase